MPKTGDGAVEAMRILKIAKDSAVKARVQAINQLKSVLINAEPALREQLAPLGIGPLIRRCAELDPADYDGLTATVTLTLRLLACRARYLGGEIRGLNQRLRCEGSFAAMCGVSPVEASSGKIQRHRLNRGGQRQANAALFRAVIVRLRWDARPVNI